MAWCYVCASGAQSRRNSVQYLKAYSLSGLCKLRQSLEWVLPGKRRRAVVDKLKVNLAALFAVVFCNR